MILIILKMIATSGFLTALECTEFVSERPPAPDPTGGAYSAPPDPLAGLRGPTFKGEERGGRGEMKGTGGTAPFCKFLDASWNMEWVKMRKSKS